ncbi:MAG: hypothetical protein ABIP94_03105 [Planctomycetota bacterium]
MLSSLCLLSSLVGSVVAQGYTTNFELFAASAAGTPCAGQDGFYVPAVAGSLDGNIHTYAGNTLGIPGNANGGANFWGGLSAGGTAFARSQRALTLPTGKIRIEYDVCCNYLGAAVPPTNNIGSFSFQPSTGAIYVNLLAAYPAGVTFPPTTWDANVITRGATPPATVTTVLANVAFQGLAMGVWHHWGVTIDLVAGTHDSFSITNGVTGITTTYVPGTPLLLPTSAIGAPLPTDFRFFAGGGTAGNVFAIDNFTVTNAAEYTTFGAGCPGALGVPTLAAAPGSLPVLGSTLTVNLGNLPVGVAIMITGLSNTLFGGAIPLPLPLAGLGFPGCNLLVDAVLTDLVSGSGTTASWSFAVPPANSLRGVQLFNQGASLDTGPAFLAFSNGGRAVLGL